MIRLHESERDDQLARALFALVGVLMPYHFSNVLFRPLEFELPCRFTPAKYKPMVDAYMSHYHKHDVWLKRSPVHPGVTAVRHGDHTPAGILLKSTFYKKILKPTGVQYAASIVAWRGTTWLSTMTLMRTPQQGEFTDAEMREMEALQPHFESVIRRIAGQQESRLIHSSLGRFISALPTASIVLDWDLRPMHFSARAARLCAQWSEGARVSRLKSPKRFRVPGDILASIESLRPELTNAGRPRGRSRRDPFRKAHPHPKVRWLSAAIEFMPSRSLTLSKGTFLVTLNEERADDKGASLARKISELTPREQECAVLVAEGLQNNEIAKRLGKSAITVRNQLTSIFGKLGIGSRHKLIAAFAQLDAAGRKKLRVKGTSRRESAASEVIPRQGRDGGALVEL